MPCAAKHCERRQKGTTLTPDKASHSMEGSTPGSMAGHLIPGAHPGDGRPHGHQSTLTQRHTGVPLVTVHSVNNPIMGPSSKQAQPSVAKGINF